MALSFRKRRSRRRGLLTAAGVVAVVAALGAAGLWWSGYDGQSIAGLFTGGGSNAAAGGPTVMRRLTQLQYKGIIADTFGADIKIGGRFEPDIRDSGLQEVGAGKVSIAASGLAQYANMARTIAAQVMDDRHRAVFVRCSPKSPTEPDDECAGQFVTEAGRLLYRRPLTDHERTALVAGAAAATKTLGSFNAGLETTLASMLEAPQFLFNWEVTDGSNSTAPRLDAYSKAARLSFFLWNAAPDTTLLTAAEHGDLDSRRGVARQVDRMLASPRLEAGVRAFFYDMLGFDGFEALAKDATIYPKYSYALALDAQEQTLRTITDLLLTQDGDYRDIFTTRKTFLSRPLGALYDVPVAGASAQGGPDGWQPYVFPEGDPRVGILGQASFLALHSHPGRSSPTLRGKALREIVLCQKVPDPPGNVNFNIVQDTSNPLYKTVRQRLQAHATNPTCAGCHKLVDPVGLGIENFNSVGAFRSGENGATIDASGILDGASFTNAAGLAKAVHDHPAVPACLVNRLYAYGVGRTPTKGEATWLMDEIQERFAADGYQIVPLLRRIAESDAFFHVIRPESEAQPTRSANLERAPSQGEAQ